MVEEREKLRIINYKLRITNDYCLGNYLSFTWAGITLVFSGDNCFGKRAATANITGPNNQRRFRADRGYRESKTIGINLAVARHADSWSLAD